jgi:hypothetical protein
MPVNRSPHSRQNFAPGRRAAPQLGHVRGVGLVPSSVAGSAPSGLSSAVDTLLGAPQFGQNSSAIGMFVPQTEHLTAVAPEAVVVTVGPPAAAAAERGAPQFGQYSVPAGLSVPHTAQVTVPAGVDAVAGAAPFPPDAAVAAAAAASIGEPQFGQ